MPRRGIYVPQSWGKLCLAVSPDASQLAGWLMFRTEPNEGRVVIGKQRVSSESELWTAFKAMFPKWSLRSFRACLSELIETGIVETEGEPASRTYRVAFEKFDDLLAKFQEQLRQKRKGRHA